MLAPLVTQIAKPRKEERSPWYARTGSYTRATERTDGSDRSGRGSWLPEPLGATRRQVVSIVLSQILIPVAAGLASGIVASRSLGRFIQEFLFEESPLDPVMFTGGVLSLALVARAACAVPAWRAALVDPGTALRCEIAPTLIRSTRTILAVVAIASRCDAQVRVPELRVSRGAQLIALCSSEAASGREF